MRPLNILHILALPSIISGLALPAPATLDPSDFTFDLSDFTLGEVIFYNSSAESALTKRSVPAECSFLKSGYDYHYAQFTLSGGNTACIGWLNTPDCGSGAWAANEYNDMNSAVRQQVTKDGQWKSSTSGWWTATFQLFTTAFEYRGSYTLFEWALLLNYSKSHKYRTFYFSYNFDFLQVDRSHLCTNA